MQSNFETALAHVLDFEGGYSDHPSDPGGATKYGITHITLREFRGRPVTKDDVRRLTKAEAARIYRSRYWEAASCPVLPPGIDLAMFDCAVNQGVGRARRFLQQAARVKVDGVIGPVTLTAVSQSDPEALLNEFMARRMRAYGLLGRLFRTFGLGWSRRLMAIHAASLALAGSEPVSQPPSRYSMDFILKRLREPSTYAGIAALLASIGLLGLSEQQWNEIFGAVAAIAAAVAILTRERSDDEDAAPGSDPGPKSGGDT